jgi:hypothetical protein
VLPATKEGGDFKVVLLQHHHVAIATNAAIGEPDELISDARLFQPFGGTMIVGRVVRGFAEHDPDRNPD